MPLEVFDAPADLRARLAIDNTEKLEQLPKALFDAPDLQDFLQNL
jgi:hypothetical protein